MTRASTLGTSTGQVVTSAAGAGLSIATPSIAAMVALPIPIVGAAVAGITIALAAIFNRKGPKQKVATTHIVDELEPQLKANVQAYFAGPRTKESQALALANFDKAWAYLASAQACGSPDMGNPGKACIADRSPGGKWDWFSYYRDPIASDQTTAATLSDTLGLSSTMGGMAPELLIAIVLIAVALVL